MTDKERDELRALQDRAIARAERAFGDYNGFESALLGDENAPSVSEARQFIYAGRVVDFRAIAEAPKGHIYISTPGIGARIISTD